MIRDTYWRLLYLPFIAANVVYVTGLIYVILIAVWGVVLVPRWLRRHDENQNTDRVGALEAALTEGVAERSGHGRPRAESWGEYLRGLASVDLRGVVPAVRSGNSGTQRAAARRGRILIGLATTVAISLVGAVIGVLPGIFLVATSLTLVGYLTAMFYFMTQQGHVSAPRATTAAAEGAESSRVSAEMEQGQVVDGVRVVADEDHGWAPQATTLPTYVSKTKASKIPRRIDLTSGWTGADMVAQAKEQQASPALSEAFDREWAAVEPDADVEVARYASGAEDEDATYYRRAVNE